MENSSIGKIIEETFSKEEIQSDLCLFLMALGDSENSKINKKLKEKAIYKISSFLQLLNNMNSE